MRTVPIASKKLLLGGPDDVDSEARRELGMLMVHMVLPPLELCW
jgi:hypothetical protein